MKGHFGKAFTALTTKSVSSYSEDISPLIPSSYRNGRFFFGVNGADTAFVWGNYNSSLRAYQLCPVVSSIINRKAQCEVNGIQRIVDAKGNTSESLQAKQLTQLLRKPNYMQSGREFKAQNSVYQQIYGYCPVLVIKPVGFEDDFSKWKMWNLPPWMIQVLDNQGMFYELSYKPFQSIWLNYLGHSIELNQDNVFFLKENQISTGTFMTNSEAANVSMHLPDSKLSPLRHNISNITDSLNSRGSLVRDRGPQWILTNDTNDSAEAGVFPLDPKIKNALYDDFKQYGIMAGQRKAIISDARLKLQTVGFDVAQLQLLEGEIQDAKFIADGLNYPPYLLGLVDAKFDNQQIAERSLYTNSIIPDVISDDEQWAELFGLDKLGLSLVTDFSHIPALQENLAEKGKGILAMNQGLQIAFYNNLITLNRWRELTNEEKVTGGDKFYYQLLAAGFTFGQVAPIAPTQTESK